MSNHRIALLCALAACSGTGQTSPDAATGGSADAAIDAGTTGDPGDVELLVPIRRQWENAHGYCGEMSVQAIAMSYGAWISQQIVRDVAGSELLLGANDEAALQTLQLTHTTWNTGAASPQALAFTAWVKHALEQRAPVIYGVYLTDAGNDPDYDHIIPAFGVHAASPGDAAPTDVLISSSNFGQRIERAFGQLAATRTGCTRSSTQGGCIPSNVDYGVAITGIAGADRPVRIAVAGDSEPNVSIGEVPAQLAVTVTASALTTGHAYALQRRDGYTGAYHDVTTFTATAEAWTYADPTPVRSDHAAYYRCVAR